VTVPPPPNAPEEETPGTPESEPAPVLAAARQKGGSAIFVSIGILASRMFGVLRQILQAKYLGVAPAADAFTAAFKIPNLLQNLFGEGALSASFIPVYSRLLARGEEEEAGRVAGAVLSLLTLTVSVIVLVGVVATPVIIPLIAAGFEPERRDLTIRFTRILFPGAGIFVVSAWCLGVLNTHRKFLLSYSAPVLWNVAMIGALLLYGGKQTATDLAATLAWASVIGAAMQFLVQVPSTLRVAKHLRFGLALESAHTRAVMRNFGPVFVSRGVVQLSAYIDQWIANFLPVGIVSTLGYAQTIYVLPVSLFGMAVSAAQLPEMSSAVGTDDEIATFLRKKLDGGLRQIAYFVIPSAMAFVAFGDVITRVLLERGHFAPQNTLYTWGILAGSAVGLLASTMGRLYSSTYYALHDTKTPLRFAMIRVALTTVLGWLFALPLPRLLGLDAHWGAAGLTISAGIAGWVEFILLRSRLNQRIGHTGLPASAAVQLWGAAAVGAAAGWGMRLMANGQNKYVEGFLVLGAFSAVYLGATIALRVPEARTALRRITRR
jgi:putative peptidoglycan lipid II flippase